MPWWAWSLLGFVIWFTLALWIGMAFGYTASLDPFEAMTEKERRELEWATLQRRLESENGGEG